ncbi:rCG42735, isoform CRA_b [Rattus norvegicus]|uniref:RCG42735, isoform CRA_b n=1 Tax=Rattus norvegicus TaxID=10116 RepID=A6K1G2_RAT|nr:rCG42735, isoform CRA_b [Rattus norvegicus]
MRNGTEQSACRSHGGEDPGPRKHCHTEATSVYPCGCRGRSVGFRAAVVCFAFSFILFCFVLILLSHSIFDQSFSLSSLLWKIVTLT